MLSDETRKKISKYRVDLFDSDAPVSIKAFMTAVHDAGIPSLGDLAVKLGVSKQFLSYVARGNGRMPKRLQRQIQKLTKYPTSSWD